MASDLAAVARTDLIVELCGDVHFGNFRPYLSPERQLVFDLNDFGALPRREQLLTGRRVVEGQRLIRETKDVLPGWARYEHPEGDIDHYSRQLWGGKGQLEVEAMRPDALAVFAEMRSQTVACAYAPSGDAMMMQGYIDEGGNSKTPWSRSPTATPMPPRWIMRGCSRPSTIVISRRSATSD